MTGSHRFLVFARLVSGPYLFYCLKASQLGFLLRRLSVGATQPGWRDNPRLAFSVSWPHQLHICRISVTAAFSRVQTLRSIFVEVNWAMTRRFNSGVVPKRGKVRVWCWGWWSYLWSGRCQSRYLLQRLGRQGQVHPLGTGSNGAAYWYVGNLPAWFWHAWVLRSLWSVRLAGPGAIRKVDWARLRRSTSSTGRSFCTLIRSRTTRQRSKGSYAVVHCKKKRHAVAKSHGRRPVRTCRYPSSPRWKDFESEGRHTTCRLRFALPERPTPPHQRVKAGTKAIRAAICSAQYEYWNRRAGCGWR